MKEIAFLGNFALDYNHVTGDYVIIDDPTGTIMATIHTAQWTTSPKENEKLCIEILKTFVANEEE